MRHPPSPYLPAAPGKEIAHVAQSVSSTTKIMVALVLMIMIVMTIITMVAAAAAVVVLWIVKVKTIMMGMTNHHQQHIISNSSSGGNKLYDIREIHDLIFTLICTSSLTFTTKPPTLVTSTKTTTIRLFERLHYLFVYP